jgi:CheY-like chemotaxis protein
MSTASSQIVILVVDDNGVLRMHAAELLKEAGYEVLEAADTEAAVGFLEARSDIKLLFTDVQLPAGRDGLSLAQQVTRQWPDVLLLITSGGPKIADESIPHDARFLTKPYSNREVLGHIDAMIKDQAEAKSPAF